MSMSSKISKHEEDTASDSSNDECDQEEEEFESEEVKEIDNQMSMEELLAMQEKIGVKAFSKKILNTKQSSLKKPNNNNKEKNFKRANKNRPRELPLQRKPARKMNYIDKEKPLTSNQIIRDPRFDDLSGKLDIIAWKKNFQFLEEERMQEINILKKALKKEKHSEKQSKLKETIQRMENQNRERDKMNQERELKREERKMAISSMKEGRAPRYTSRKEKYLKMKMSQFDQLKSNDKVEKYLKRKEKKKFY
ncbi:UNVERIFIED_CONTAM: hypothetical protein RMT77_018694 [Armadillidium vulgare]